MSGMKTRKRQKQHSQKYERLSAALEACGLTEKYKATFLEHEMDDDTVQQCIDDPQHFDYYLCAIIPKIGHKVKFVSEFRKTKVNSSEPTSSSSTKKASTSSQGRIQQPPVFVNTNLRKIKMEIDYVPVKAEKEEAENSNDEQAVVESCRNQMEVDGVSIKVEPEEAGNNNNNNDGEPEMENSKNPTSKLTDVGVVMDSSSPGPSSTKFTTSSNPECISSSGKIQVLPLNKLTDDESLELFSPIPAPDSVFVTWNVTLEKIRKLGNGEEAVKILEILPFLYADKIQSTFLHSLVPEIQDEEFSAALKLLEKNSMIKMNLKDCCLSIHRQLQLVILQSLKESNDVSNVVMNILEKCTTVLKSIKLPKSGDIFLNVHHIVNSSFALIPVTEQFLDFLNEFGFVLWRASRYSESLALYKKAYSNRLELLGENHQKTLNSQHQIALQLYQLGRYDEALALYKEVLRKKEIHRGADHPETITTKHNMAMVLREQEKYGEALELLQQVLAQRNKIQGENHPQTLSTQLAIAVVHSDLGDLSKALALYEQVEKKQVEILGPAHRDVLTTKHNKAIVLLEMGKLEEASKILHEVHEKCKEIVGENHLSTINTLEWIGMTLEKEGKLTEALEIYQKVYEIYKTELDQDHPLTIDAKAEIENAQSQLRRKMNRKCKIRKTKSSQ